MDKMQNQKTILTLTIITLLALPLISAALGGNFGYWGYNSPLDYLENEWVLFTILFLIFFSVIYYSINKAIKNPSVAVIVGLGISLFISLAISRKGFLWNYGQGFDTWILLIAALIGIGFLIKFAAETFNATGAVIAVIGIWLLLLVIEPYQILPETLLYSDGFIVFYNSLRSFVGLIILIIIAVLLSKNKKSDTVGGQFLDLFKKKAR